MQEMQEIMIKNIPNYLKNTPFYNNLDISDDDNLIKVIVHNGIINNSEDFLKVCKILGFWCSNQITSEMYKYIVNNFHMWRKSIDELDKKIKLDLFKDILKINTLYKLFDYAMKTDNLLLYEELYKIRHKYFRKQDICNIIFKKNYSKNCNYSTFENIMEDDGLFFKNVAELGSLNCLKFLFENEEKEKFNWALFYAYVNDRFECFKFLFENNVKISHIPILEEKYKNRCDEYLKVNNYVLEF